MNGLFNYTYKWCIPWAYNPLIRSPLNLTSLPTGHPGVSQPKRYAPRPLLTLQMFIVAGAI